MQEMRIARGNGTAHGGGLTNGRFLPVIHDTCTSLLGFAQQTKKANMGKVIVLDSPMIVFFLPLIHVAVSFREMQTWVRRGVGGTTSFIAFDARRY